VLSPDRFDYPYRCKACRLNFYYAQHAYRLRMLDWRLTPTAIAFEDSFQTEDDMWSAAERFDPIRYLALARGPNWLGFTWQVTPEERSILQRIFGAGRAVESKPIVANAEGAIAAVCA
jgi:hypothetical protein